LCQRFGADTVNLVIAHGMVRGGTLGGGERDAQTIEDYWIDPTAFPTSAHYVALGHLHRTQQLPGGAQIWYSGSPIQVDFGEGGDAKHVMVVDAVPGKPAVVIQVPLANARRLRTIEGTLSEIATVVADVGDDLLRVLVREPTRAGLADDVRDLLPNAIDIRVVAPDDAEEPAPLSTRQGLTAHELFAAFLAEQSIADERVEQLFARLLDEVSEMTA
jgi:exonuclease SbcD